MLTALTVLSLSAAIAFAWAAPAYAATASVNTPVAFICGCDTLFIWSGVPGESAGRAFEASAPGTAAPHTNPSLALLANGDAAVAFHGANGDLWTSIWSPNTGISESSDTGLGMAPGTSPAILDPNENGTAVVVFQSNTNYLWSWLGAPGTHGQGGGSTGFGMAPGTSPSIASATAEEVAVAFQANTGYLWTMVGYDGGNFFVNQSSGSTLLGMAPGTSPSIVPYTGFRLIDTPYQFDVAFQANTGVLWEWQGALGAVGSGFPIGNGMPRLAAGTSPSITTEVGDLNPVIAFQGDDNDLWSWAPPSFWSPVGSASGAASFGAGTEDAMAAGTSPSIAGLASGGAAAGYTDSGGGLWTAAQPISDTPFGGISAPTVCMVGDCAFGAFAISTGSSPSIGFYVAPHGLSLTAKGNLMAKLGKPRTLVLLVYSMPKPRGRRHTPRPLKLLGRVALGNHSAGLSKIMWGLRVRGRRLGAGNYIAELEAQTGRTKTTGGPTVEFDLGKGGKLKIIAESSPARG